MYVSFKKTEYILEKINENYTAIPYRASTGPEQGFLCVVFPHRGKLFSIQGSQVMKTGFSL